MHDNMNNYASIKAFLMKNQYTWLITGVAGFIGSHLLEILLKLEQRVIGLDNFSTGHQKNLDQVQALVKFSQWQNFTFVEGDIRDLSTGQRVTAGVDYVLHQAALGSVPRSLKDPVQTNEVNITGFLNMLVAARDAGVKRFVYAASSSTYGDHLALPKVEDIIGKPLSPYAVTKRVNELYAEVFFSCYGLSSIGLRYFNVFGPRQAPNGAYAAVIPRWISRVIHSEPMEIYGDGETSRDFTFIDNVIQVNLLAALTENPLAINQIYNVAVSQRTTLNALAYMIHDVYCKLTSSSGDAQLIYRNFREGDVHHSQASIDKAKKLLAYQPSHLVEAGLLETVRWYLQHD